MTYDRADWHYGGDFPEDLPPECGATHIGMFLAWIINNSLESEFHREESADALEAVRARAMTGREFLIDECDEKFWDEDLSDEGNEFAQEYYGVTTEGGQYFTDYEQILCAGLPSLYHVEDTWESYDKIAPTISKRFAEWKAMRAKL